jgi:hypothetical protein
MGIGAKRLLSALLTTFKKNGIFALFFTAA